MSVDESQILFSSNSNTLKVFGSGTGTLNVPTGGGSTGFMEVDFSDVSVNDDVGVLAYATYDGKRYLLNSEGASDTDILSGKDVLDFQDVTTGDGVATIVVGRAASSPQNNNVISLTVKYFLVYLG